MIIVVITAIMILSEMGKTSLPPPSELSPPRRPLDNRRRRRAALSRFPQRARATTVASLALCSLDDLGRDRDARRREGMLETSHCRIFLNKVAFGITTAEESCACWQHCRSVDGVLENAR